MCKEKSIFVYKNDKNQILNIGYDENSDCPLHSVDRITDYLVYQEYKSEVNNKEFTYIKNLNEYLEEEGDDILYKMNLYESSVGYSVDDYDKDCCGQIGYVVVTKEAFESIYNSNGVSDGSRNNSIRGLIHQEINNYNKFLSGEVYYYELIEDGEIVDSCGGFYSIDDIMNSVGDKSFVCVKH